MTPAERAQHIDAVRERLQWRTERGYADGWTETHLRALLDEIDELNGRIDLGVAGLGRPARAV